MSRERDPCCQIAAVPDYHRHFQIAVHMRRSGRILCPIERYFHEVLIMSKPPFNAAVRVHVAITSSVACGCGEACPPACHYYRDVGADCTEQHPTQSRHCWMGRSICTRYTTRISLRPRVVGFEQQPIKVADSPLITFHGTSSSIHLHLLHRNPDYPAKTIHHSLSLSLLTCPPPLLLPTLIVAVREIDCFRDTFVHDADCRAALNMIPNGQRPTRT